MAYSYRYINRLNQFGEINYTLILEDISNLELPAVRIDKTFKVDPSLIDDNFLYNEARTEILRIMNEPQSEPLLTETEGKDG